MAKDIEDEPLDPAVEAIRRKLLKLLIVSGGIMMLGLMAVLIAVVHKINQGNESVASRVVTSGELQTPAGSQILHTVLDGNRIMLTLKLADGSTLIQVYRADGKVAARYEVK